jgi:hypothetical protein
MMVTMNQKNWSSNGLRNNLTARMTNLYEVTTSHRHTCHKGKKGKGKVVPVLN